MILIPSKNKFSFFDFLIFFNFVFFVFFWFFGRIVQIEKPIENTTQKNSKKQTKQKPLKANDEEWVSNNNKKNLPIIPNQSQTTTTTNPIQNLPRITINNNSDEEVEFEDVFSEDDLSDSKVKKQKKDF